MGERDNRTVEARGSSPLISTKDQPLILAGEGSFLSHMLSVHFVGALELAFGWAFFVSFLVAPAFAFVLRPPPAAVFDFVVAVVFGAGFVLAVVLARRVA